MDLIMNWYAKAQGWTAVLLDWLPVVGAVGSILGIASAILLRAAGAHDPAGVFHAIHPTADEAAAFALSVGVIKVHMNHQANAAKIEDHAESLAKVIPQADPKP